MSEFCANNAPALEDFDDGLIAREDIDGDAGILFIADSESLSGEVKLFKNIVPIINTMHAALASGFQ